MGRGRQRSHPNQGPVSRPAQSTDQVLLCTAESVSIPDSVAGVRPASPTALSDVPRVRRPSRQPQPWPGNQSHRKQAEAPPRPQASPPTSPLSLRQRLSTHTETLRPPELLRKTHGNAQAGLIRQLLQVIFPCTIPAAITSPAIGAQQ